MWPDDLRVIDMTYTDASESYNQPPLTWVAHSPSDSFHSIKKINGHFYDEAINIWYKTQSASGYILIFQAFPTLIFNC